MFNNTYILLFIIVVMVFVLIIMRMAVIIKDKKLQINAKKFKQSENRFEALVENGADSVIILSTDYTPIYISRSIKNILGYTPDELLAFDLLTLIHPEDVDETKRNLNESINDLGMATWVLS